MADQSIQAQITVDTGNAPQTIGDLRQQYKDLFKEIGNTVQGTQEYYDKLKQLAEAKGAITELRKEIRALDPHEQVKLVADSLRGLAGGFEAAVGSVALFAGKNKEVEEALLKVNAAIAITHGLTEFSQGIRKINALGGIFISTLRGVATAQKAAQVATVANTTVIEGETVVTEEATVATEGLSTAMKIGLTAGIGAILLLIPLFAEAISNSSTETKKAIDYSEEYGKVIGKAAEKIAESNVNVQRMKLLFDDAKAGIVSKRDALQAYNEKFGEVLGTQTSFNKAEKEFSDKTDAYKAAMQQRAIADAAYELEKEQISELLKKQATGEISLWQEVKTGVTQAVSGVGSATLKVADYQKENAKEIQTLIDKYTKLGDTATETANKIDKKSKIDTTGNNKKDDEKSKEALKALKEYVEESNKILENAEQKEITDENIKYEKLKTDLIAANVSTITLTTQHQKNLSDIAIKFEKERALAIAQIKASIRAKEFAEEQKGLQELTTQVTQYFEKSNELNKTEAQKKLEEENNTYNKLIQEAMFYGRTTEQIDAQHYKNLDQIQKLADAESLKTLQDAQAKETEALKKEINLTINNNKITYKDKINTLALEKKANDLALSQHKITADQHLEIEEELSKAQQEIKKKDIESYTQYGDDVASVLNSVADAIGKNTQLGKDISIAAATISTITGAVKAYESFAEIPVIGVGLGIAAAAAALAAGYANVKKIEAVKVPGGGGSSGASIPGGAAPPSAPVIPNSAPTTNLSQQSINQIQSVQQKQPAVRAYVVENDITATQQRVSGYKNSSTIGARQH